MASSIKGFLGVVESIHSLRVPMMRQMGETRESLYVPLPVPWAVVTKKDPVFRKMER